VGHLSGTGGSMPQEYTLNNPHEKKRIFGAVSKFRYILIAGIREDWQTENAIDWRAYHNNESKIEIRSSDTFKDAIQTAKDHFQLFWSFEENPVSLNHSMLKNYWKNYDYMNFWRKVV